MRVLAQDLLYGGGGSTANLLAVWRARGVDRLMREAAERGALLCGISAGAKCWAAASLTDSYGPLPDSYGPLPDSYGPLPDSYGPLPDSYGPLPDSYGPLPDSYGPLPDSYGPLAVLADGLGLLPGSFCPRAMPGLLPARNARAQSPGAPPQTPLLKRRRG
ncbi:Type 1 glutamine amidotransferase-like domain-containing protein [Streptomyces sp. NEAU-H3]|uniref:Type 1 glutamine amidotransferase-like domain-containing protein n=1 Tax=Streptomyces sp. NEAU-H3 TaxID=2720636 RepID=UPI0014399068|nr:Type 1 glutamine amidotransferase-like domain-containing protein [Streptomyces sp. NEAU-H3]NJA58715.1 type 1 glutamine amidotransferase-like domain-containing protein [Streptomyces sp. NEAU-H3]